MQKDEHVYFISAGKNGPVKIGRAKNPMHRLGDLQVAHHQELTLLLAVLSDNAMHLEKSLHRALADVRIRGEWFARSRKLSDAMTMLRRGLVEVGCHAYPTDVELVIDPESEALHGDDWRAIMAADMRRYQTHHPTPKGTP